MVRVDHAGRTTTGGRLAVRGVAGDARVGVGVEVEELERVVVVKAVAVALAATVSALAAAGGVPPCSVAIANFAAAASTCATCSPFAA